MKLAIVYFTYGPDFDLLIQSLTSLKTALKDISYKVFAIDDEHTPCNNKQIKELEKDNILYFQTDHDRNGNLNGYDNLKAETKIFDNISKTNAYDIIVKCDSDIIFGPRFLQWIKDFKDSDKYYSGAIIQDSKFRNCYFNGGCYLLKPIVTETLYRDVLDYPTYYSKAQEDYEICTRLRRNFKDKELNNYRVYHQIQFYNITVEQNSGYYLDPRYILNNSNEMQWIKKTNIYIACMDDQILLNDNYNRTDIKQLELEAMKELNK